MLPKQGARGSIPGQGSRSHMLQLRPSTVKEINKNKYYLKKKRKAMPVSSCPMCPEPAALEPQPPSTFLQWDHFGGGGWHFGWHFPRPSPAPFSFGSLVFSYWLVQVLYTLMIWALSHILVLFFGPLCHLSLDFVVWGLRLTRQTILEFVSPDFPGSSYWFLGFLVSLFAPNWLTVIFSIYSHRV